MAHAIEALERLVDLPAARRVFGEPIERGGVVLVPVAQVRGGGGGGGGESTSEEGGGAGYGLSARPVGAFAIADGRASWVPVVDVTRVILGAQLLGGLAMLLFAGGRKRGARRRALSMVRRSVRGWSSTAR